MSVRQWGRAPDDPAAESALLLHCSLAQAGVFAGFARHLPDRFSIRAPDLVGHGRGPDHDPALDYHDQATEEALAHLPAAPCHLIGHSLGATLALRIALDHPHRVRSLTLFEPVLFCASNGPGRQAHDAAVAGMPGALARGDRAEAARIFLSLWGTHPFDALPDKHRTYMADRIWIPQATEPALLDDRAGILPRLTSLKSATLLLRGETSPPVIAEITARLADDIPDVRICTLSDAGHMAPITHPGATAQAISDFLGSL